MSCTIDETRIVIKYSTISGQVPTIPLSDDHGDGTWIPTDLYIGELFMNSVDNKIWIRTDNGIIPVGATGGTTSFIGDYVHISGGTYSGTVYAPTFSAGGITASYIISDLFQGNFNGTFTGDGSGLTGINANWLGGTVSNQVWFENITHLDNTTYINGPITTLNDCVEFDTDICVTGGVSASYFIGDGSGLTNIPLGTQSDTYTETASLSGNSIVFTRNDTTTYNVNLTPILATQSIGFIYWNELSNTFEITLNSGEVISTTIDTFTGLTSLTTISAPTFYGGEFFGTFTGTFSNDIYTTSANLSGTDAVFTRTDGVTYSLDLSTLSGGGSGSVGPTGSTGATGSQGYRAVMNLSYTGSSLTLGLGTITLPIGVPINNLGWQQGTRIRVWHSATEYMEGQITSVIANPQTTGINVNIDYVVGSGTFGQWYCGIAGDRGVNGASASQTLSQTLVNGNSTLGNNINLTEGDQIISDDTEKTIEFQEPRILIQNTKDIPGATETSILELKQGSAISQLEARTTDTTTSEYKSGYIQISHEETRYGSYNSSLYNDAYFTTFGGNTYQPQPEARIVTADQYGNSAYMTFNPGSVEFGGSNSDGFQGIEYAGDYSGEYSIRSLVDKEYVDNAVSGAGSGITYSGSMDYMTYFDTDNSLGYTDTYYNSGRTTFGHYTGTPWIWDSAGKLNVYSPYSLQPAVIAEGGQFGAMFIASDNTAGGQLIGLQAYAHGSQVSGNLGLYSRADGTQSSNIGAQIVAYNGVLYPGYGGASNTGLLVDVSSYDVDPSVAGLTNSGIQVSVTGRVGDNNYIGQFQDGSEGVGKVLTCIDGTGLARWQTPTGGGGGATGPAGPTGSQGPTGATGPQGPAGTGSTFSGGTVSGATTFQSDVTFNSNIIDENGTSIDVTNIINMTNLALMYNT